MSELIKPYELSVWEDVLVKETIEEEGEEKEISYFKERKITNIGSSTMTAPGKAYDVILHKNKNGEKTLSFSIKSRYYDPDTEQMVENPFVSFLINERKVKLHYDGEWHDFIIKEQTESNEEFEWHYECQDAFVLELSKTGYNIEFSNELGNNQGSALELALATLKNTDWQVADVDVEPPKVNEPVYYANLLYGEDIPILTIKDMDTNEDVEITEQIPIFIFYSYVNNKDGELVQFILQSATYDIDSNNNITAKNYLIEDKLEFKNDGFYKGETQVIQLNDLYLDHQVYRIVLKQLTTYDPVMQRTVDRYAANGMNIYHYADYVYTSSDVVVSYVTNGSNFNVYDGEKVDYLQGWTNRTGLDNNPELNLTTFPEDMYQDLIPLDSLKQAEGYIETKFKTTQNPINLTTEGYLFNSGIEDNANIINNISQGEEFLLRWRAAKSGMIGEASDRKLEELNPNNFGAVVGFYEKITDEKTGKTYNQLDTSKILLNFYATDMIEPKKLNNRLVSGYFTSDNPEVQPDKKSFYIIDGVVQKPSTRYIYQEGKNGAEYIWDTVNKIYRKRTQNISTGVFVYEDIENPTRKTSYVIEGEPVSEPDINYVYIDKNTEEKCVWSNTLQYYVDADKFFDYYYLTSKAIMPVTSEVLTSSATKIGIFFYIKNTEDINNHYYYFQDIQLTRYYQDIEGNPVVLGEAPIAKSVPKDYFYIAPETNAIKEHITTYASLDTLADALNVRREDIKPVYTTDDLVFIEKDGDFFYVIREKKPSQVDLFHVKGYALAKTLSIEASKSNCFNILQTIAETFECWLDIEVFHDEDGAIELDIDGKPIKYIYLRRYAGKDNFVGFKYGINLKSVERVIDSNEIVTKLIVDQSQSDLVDSGVVTIQNADSNISGESYILNFDYFCNQNLLNREEVEKDYLKLFEDLKVINSNLRELNQRKIDLSNSLNKIGANRNIYITLLDTAKDRLSNALEDFKRQTGHEYADYQNLEQKEKDKIIALFEMDTFMNTIGEIYSNTIVVNNYEGLRGVNDEEYERIREEFYGNKNGYINVSRVYDSVINKDYIRLVLNDYIVPFSFKIGEEVYSTSVNQKTFNIQVDHDAAVIITNFTYGDKYSGIFTTDEPPTPVEEIIPVLNSEQRFVLRVAVPTLSLQDRIDAIIENKKERIALFENKYSNFILEGNWSSTNYINDELYFLDALNLSRVSAFPKITYNIEVADIAGLKEYDQYNFDTGDKTFIEDTEFFGWTEVDNLLTPVREEVIVSEIEWHLDNPDKNSITVQNYKTNFEDLFQRIQATVQTVQYNETTYPKTSVFVNTDGTLNESILLNSLNKISGKHFALTSDGSVYIDEGMIIVKNLTNTANCVRINSEGIQITSDGGATWSTAISGQGINIGKVFTGSINTKEVAIGNPDNASFYWDSNGLNAYKLDEDTDRYDYNTYVRFDEFGLYGIKDSSSLKLGSLEEVKEKAHFGITWDGFFIKNSYGNEEGDGRVEISSDNDFQVIQKINGEDCERIKIGALEFDEGGKPIKYGLRLRNIRGEDALVTDSEGNITLMGTLQSDNYQPSNGLLGWKIDRKGDAIFNNITARGSIKTAVFEYAEIQAVSGVSIFRPSSTIRQVEIDDIDNPVDLIVEVENPYLFNVDNWVKIGNYNTTSLTPGEDLTTAGLGYVFRISNISENDRKLTLEKGADILINVSTDEIVGGALIGMGSYDSSQAITYENYGVAINSSDNALFLPPRAISLFETEIFPNPEEPVKIGYKLNGILGTLPNSIEHSLNVNQDIYKHMEGTQGIYTDNMYIGDETQYIAFYTDKEANENLINEKKLIVCADEINFSTNGRYANLSNHLSLNDEGLLISAGESAAKIQISTETNNEGIIIYGTDGTQLAKYGESAIIGDNRRDVENSGFYIEINKQQIGFYEWNGENVEPEKVAYIDNSELRVKNTMSFGHFRFTERSNGHFTLKII